MNSEFSTQLVTSSMYTCTSFWVMCGHTWESWTTNASNLASISGLINWKYYWLDYWLKKKNTFMVLYIRIFCKVKVASLHTVLMFKNDMYLHTEWEELSGL